MSEKPFSSNMNDTLDISYDYDTSTVEGKINRYVSEFGGDPVVLNWMYGLDNYPDFIRKLRLYTASAHEDNVLTKEDEELISTSYAKEDFFSRKEILKEVFDLYDKERLGLFTEEEIDDAPFPARDILNGNFNRYDKSLLTEEMKVQYNVHGLRDIEYDIYVDEKRGVLIPVYYNLATHNEKWYGFCVYLKKLYSCLKIDANPYLPLITFDRRLLAVDCIDETQTNELNGLVAAECENNIIFAIRECARFNTASGKKQRTELSLGDWTWLWLYAQCFNTYREAPRQTGKTFLMTMVFGVEFAISYRDLMAIVVHFKASEAIKNRNKMLESANALPNYLKYHNIKFKTVRGKEKQEFSKVDMVGGGSPKSENRFKNNILKTVAVGKTESTAEQAGRGDTAVFIAADEINFISQVGVLLTALTFAHSTAKTLAKNAGKRYGMHFTSTAGKLNTKHGKEMYDLIYNKMCMFQVDLFSYNLEDLENYMKANSTVNFFVIKYDYDELGYTEEWLDDRIVSSKSTQDILVEIFQKWISSDDTSLFKLDQSKRLENMTKKSIEKNFMYKKNNLIKYFPRNYDMSFEDLIRGCRGLCWGVDISAGGGDYSVIYAYELATLRPVFLYKVNNLVATDFAIVTIDLARYVKFLNPGMTFVINPEQNGPGLTFIPLLIKEKDIEPHVFRHLRYYDKRVTDETMRPWHRQLSRDSYFEYGSNMTKKMQNGKSVREEMFESLLFEIMDKYPYYLSTIDLTSEVFTLHRKSGKISGKIEAKSGFHDDIICAALHGASVVLLEEYRQMLSRFFNYTVDASLIINMALASHIDAMEELGVANDLEHKIDIEVRDMYGVGGIHYQVLKLFKYVNNIRIEIKDPDEKRELYETNEEVMTAYLNTKKPSIKEYKMMEDAKAKQLQEDRQQDIAMYNQMRYESNSNTNVGNSSRSAENRTNSNSYRRANKYNTKAKMF